MKGLLRTLRRARTKKSGGLARARDAAVEAPAKEEEHRRRMDVL
jgi:hypothetical protein